MENQRPLILISNVEWKETDERKRRSFVAPQAKILIVDDNPENLMVTRSLLKRTAVFVDTAASGEECVHKVRQNIYDLILLDYMMPQMDEKFDFEDEVTQLSDIFADYEAFENGSLQLKK